MLTLVGARRNVVLIATSLYLTVNVVLNNSEQRRRTSSPTIRRRMGLFIAALSFLFIERVADVEDRVQFL